MRQCACSDIKLHASHEVTVTLMIGEQITLEETQHHHPKSIQQVSAEQGCNPGLCS